VTLRHINNISIFLPNIVMPAKEFRVGLSPGRSLDMRGMSNQKLISGVNALRPETPAFAGVTLVF